MAAALYPAYSPKSPLALGLLKLPGLAASTSLRRSGRPGQPAWMRAEGRVLHGRCLGPTRSLQDKSKARAAAMLLAGARVQGRRRLAALRSCARSDITQAINRERKLR
ncbi:hypothetical protein IE984_16295 [Klebsiella pneumoniae]|nr:hypothetical protein [Klebsiella pneumoniae]